MDTTKENIKMCEEASKVQDEHFEKQSVGDWFAFSLRSGKNGKPFVKTSNEYPYDPNYYTWLPRQDDLQEMVKKDGAIVDWGFYHFANDGIGYYLEYFNSMEQLWLAFVMKEKHSKTWNGEEWA